MAEVKRIVLFKFKAGVSNDTVKKVFGALEGLKTKIPGVKDFCWGAYSSSDNLNQGYTHGFILTFKDIKSRDDFGPHPEHKKVVETQVGPNLEGVLAFDFMV